ncbi:MAG: ATP-binding cassette domain-containing protein, partial [Singulisphaera sp.]|nr:ATP-binding cassette domain-containing protein [Singulisphaera sp.]
MGDVAIRVDGLGKQYRLGGSRERYSTLRDQIRKWTSLRGLARLATRAEHRPLFWALRNVSFEVKQGEVVGIIGRNGAGKSTLLKVLSRITEPTEGEADIHGRVGSLLEVGTGFHPELTGRENVYLNGAILGMQRAEIARKFDEIIAFAEVEQFVDTQVKHYSSGMYMRLAFAVAAHLDPEILIVDEVLAVGDAKFQKKCLGKMGEVARCGRTVLFVSHNMQTIALLCSEVICLKQGTLDYIGPTASGITQYYRDMATAANADVDAARRAGTGDARFVEAAPARPQYRPDEPKRIRFRARAVSLHLRRCHLSSHLVDETEQIVCQCDSRFLGVEAEFDGGVAEGELTIRHPWLKPGEYSVDLFLVDGKIGVLDR